MPFHCSRLSVMPDYFKRILHQGLSYPRCIQSEVILLSLHCAVLTGSTIYGFPTVPKFQVDTEVSLTFTKRVYFCNQKGTLSKIILNAFIFFLFIPDNCLSDPDLCQLNGFTISLWLFINAKDYQKTDSSTKYILTSGGNNVASR